jgi:hypothetical protein
MKGLLTLSNKADLDCLFPIKNVSRSLVGIASKYFVGLHFGFKHGQRLFRLLLKYYISSISASLLKRTTDDRHTDEPLQEKQVRFSRKTFPKVETQSHFYDHSSSC